MLKLQITLPISAESLGRWLEANHAEIRIVCMLGVYHVHVNRHRHESSKEKANVSVTRSGDVEVCACRRTVEEALYAAFEKCEQESA